MEKKIMYNSPEAASLKTVKGWVSSNNHFYGNDEHLARWDGCTHKLCECGKEIKKNYSICDSCQNKRIKEKYFKLPFKEWDGKTPLVLYSDNVYFFSEDDIINYCEENEINSCDLDLVITNEIYLYNINEDYWEDCMGGDQDYPKSLTKIIDEFNEKLKEINKTPISYGMGNYRTKYIYNDGEV